MSWREVFDSVVEEFGGWPSLEGSSTSTKTSMEKLYGALKFIFNRTILI